MCYTVWVGREPSHGPRYFEVPGSVFPTPSRKHMTTSALQQIDPQEISRRTNDQREEHLTLIKDLMDKGLSKAVITSYVRTEFGISRAQSYKDYDYADAERRAERSDNEPEDISLIDKEALMRMITELVIHAYRTKDTNAVARLTREYERLARMGGRTYGKP